MKTYFIDSFTSEKFKGNPAAVCLPDHDLDDSLMQKVATEIGFSETAFVRKTEGRQNEYTIRFFTPKSEIDLCGHATLASARVIFDTTNLESIRFFNHENIELNIGKSGAEIVMEFPVYNTEAFKVPIDLFSALGIKPTEVTNTRFSPKNEIILIEILDSASLAKLAPDFTALVKSYTGVSGVLVTAKSGEPQFDFQYRYFWPWKGTNEDPVTGAVQTFLTKYWAEKLGKTELKIFQCSNRTGTMRTELHGDKVKIYGSAVKVLEGELNV